MAGLLVGGLGVGAWRSFGCRSGKELHLDVCNFDPIAVLESLWGTRPSPVQLGARRPVRVKNVSPGLATNLGVEPGRCGVADDDRIRPVPPDSGGLLRQWMDDTTSSLSEVRRRNRDRRNPAGMRRRKSESGTTCVDGVAIVQVRRSQADLSTIDGNYRLQACRVNRHAAGVSRDNEMAGGEVMRHQPPPGLWSTADDRITLADLMGRTLRR